MEQILDSILQSDQFKDFLRDSAARIVSETTRYLYVKRAESNHNESNYPELSEAQYRYLEAKNDREERSLELQKLHISLLFKQHQELIALSIQKSQTDFEMAHGAKLMSSEETLRILQYAQKKQRLLLILSEPDVSDSCPKMFKDGLHRDARAGVKKFIERNYPLNSDCYPVEFFGKFFKSSVFDTEVKQLENLLIAVPTVVLYSDMTARNFNLSLYAWGLPEPVSETITWNWKEAKDRLIAQGIVEEEALWEISEIIIMLYQWFAALLADMYYLSVNPLHEPRLFQLDGAASITENLTTSYLDQLRELQQQVKISYEQSKREIIEKNDIATHAYLEAKAYYEQKEFIKALPLFKRASEVGHAESQCYLGKMYENGKGVSKDYEEAVKCYRKAAEQNNAEGQYRLGRMYLSVKGLKKSVDEAMKLFYKAAEQGYAEAQYWLGCIFYIGDFGVGKDYAIAMEWYRKAAEMGCAKGEYGLGNIYLERKEYHKAEMAYMSAGDQGYANSYVSLAYMYEDGVGRKKDISAALSFFHIAAEQGCGYAQYILGTRYENGEYVKKDIQKALVYDTPHILDQQLR